MTAEVCPRCLSDDYSQLKRTGAGVLCVCADCGRHFEITESETKEAATPRDKE